MHWGDLVVLQQKRHPESLSAFCQLNFLTMPGKDGDAVIAVERGEAI